MSGRGWDEGANAKIAKTGNPQKFNPAKIKAYTIVLPGEMRSCLVCVLQYQCTVLFVLLRQSIGETVLMVPTRHGLLHMQYVIKGTTLLIDLKLSQFLLVPPPGCRLCRLGLLQATSPWFGKETGEEKAWASRGSHVLRGASDDISREAAVAGPAGCGGGRWRGCKLTHHHHVKDTATYPIKYTTNFL